MALNQSHDKPRGMAAPLEVRKSFCKISMVVCNLQNKHLKKFLQRVSFIETRDDCEWSMRRFWKR